jgi:hypothetical protein
MNISQKVSSSDFMDDPDNQLDGGGGDDDNDQRLEDEMLFDDYDEDEEEDEDREGEFLNLRIKSSKQDAEISVSPSSSVSAVKEAVRCALSVPRRRYVRLVYRGRLLAPDSARISEFSIGDGDVVHAVVAAEGQQGGAQALLAHSSSLLLGDAASGLNDPNFSSAFSSSLSSLSRRALRGTGLSITGNAVRSHLSEEDEDEDETTEEDEEEGLVNNQGSRRPTASPSSLIRNRGFDRLRASMGLRRSQVAVLRAYFGPQVDRFARNHPNLGDGINDALLRRRIHEEGWMASQGPGSEFRINLMGGGSPTDGLLFPRTAAAGTSPPLFGDGMVRAGPGVRTSVVVGTDRDFFWGFVLGYCVGFLMMLWVWVPTVTQRQKMGILCGISFQLALGLLRSVDNDHLDDASAID